MYRVNVFSARTPQLPLVRPEHYAPISRDDEVEFVRRWHEHGDKRARDRVLLAYLPVIAWIAQMYSRFVPGHEADVESHCFEEALRKFDRFDPSIARFGAFIYPWIVVAARGYVLLNSRCHAYPKQWRGKIGDRIGPPSASLDAPVGSHLGDAGDATLGDLIPAEGDVVEEIEERQTEELTRRLLSEALDSLPERTAMIVRERWLAEKGLREVAEVLGITKQRTQQVEARGLEAIRDRIRFGAKTADLVDVLGSVPSAGNPYRKTRMDADSNRPRRRKQC